MVHSHSVEGSERTEWQLIVDMVHSHSGEGSVYDPAEEYYSSNNYFTKNIIQGYYNTVLNLWYRARIAHLH